MPAKLPPQAGSPRDAGGPDPDSEPAPRPLAAGERVDLWLASAPAAASAEPSQPEPGAYWDSRPARVLAVSPDVVALVAGAWSAWDRGRRRGARGQDADTAEAAARRSASATGAAQGPGGSAPQNAGGRALVRRSGREGIAEWEGHLVAPAALDAERSRALGGMEDLEAQRGATEMLVLVQLAPAATRGRLYQRRRSPRLPVRLRPVRLMSLEADPRAAGAAGSGPAAEFDDDGLLPVARLTDVSVHGAGVVVDTPLPQGTPVALEFDLPGEEAPFAVRGTVVEPAVALHGQARPQPDGLPGFRRGIEFLGTEIDPEQRRLTQTLNALQQQAVQDQPGHSELDPRLGGERP